MFTVNLDGKKIKQFATKKEAIDFMINFTITQKLETERESYIEAAVEKSELKQASEVLKHIMEKK
jgi:hypothetical protein